MLKHKASSVRVLMQSKPLNGDIEMIETSMVIIRRNDGLFVWLKDRCDQCPEP